MLSLAIILISLALVSYTAGVWAERHSGTLQLWHTVAFGIGLIFDASGTWIMSLIAQSSTSSNFAASPVGEALSTVMATTGALALILMTIHLGWAIAVLVRNREHEKSVFHRFSLMVWGVWLLPYLTGMAAAMV